MNDYPVMIFENKHFWVAMNPYHTPQEWPVLNDDLKKWLKKNTKGYNRIQNVEYDIGWNTSLVFTEEAYAVAFKLKWG